MLRRLRWNRRLFSARARMRWRNRRIPTRVFRNVLLFYLVITAAMGGFSYLGNRPELVMRIRVVSRAALDWILTDGMEVFPRLVKKIPISTSLAQSMLRQSMPSLGTGLDQSNEIRITEEVVRDILAMVTNYDLQHPASFFQGQIPALAVSGSRLVLGTPNETTPAPVTITAVPKQGTDSPGQSQSQSQETAARRTPQSQESTSPPSTQPQRPRQLNLGREPLVAIYHTHTGETYRTEDNVRGKSYAWDNYSPADGPIPGVVQVGVVIAEELRNRYGIPVVHSTKIHDYPVWSRAYMNSLVTARELVNTYKDLRLILDIHRDEGRTVSTTGESISRVLLVVTSAEDNPDLPHPRWRENLAYAQILHRKFEELYPGLSKGIQIRKDNRFNQHVHPRAILLEVGGSEDTLEQALAAARLCAHVIAEVLYDELASAGGYEVPGRSGSQGPAPPMR